MVKFSYLDNEYIVNAGQVTGGPLAGVIERLFDTSPVLSDVSLAGARDLHLVQWLAEHGQVVIIDSEIPIVDDEFVGTLSDWIDESVLG